MSYERDRQKVIAQITGKSFPNKEIVVVGSFEGETVIKGIGEGYSLKSAIDSFEQRNSTNIHLSFHDLSERDITVNRKIDVVIFLPCVRKEIESNYSESLLNQMMQVSKILNNHHGILVIALEDFDKIITRNIALQKTLKDNHIHPNAVYRLPSSKKESKKYVAFFSKNHSNKFYAAGIDNIFNTSADFEDEIEFALAQITAICSCSKDGEPEKYFFSESGGYYHQAEYGPVSVKVRECLENGKYFEGLSAFSGFDSWDAEVERKNLDSDFLDKKIKWQSIKELLDTSFKTGNRIVFMEKERTFIKADENVSYDSSWIFKINEDKVLIDYILKFFSFKFGKLTLDIHISAGKKLERTVIENMKIPVPGKEEQKKIVEQFSKYDNVVSVLSEIRESLSNNPLTSGWDENRLHNIAESARLISHQEQLQMYMERDESNKLEFKESFSMPVIKDKMMEEKKRKEIREKHKQNNEKRAKLRGMVTKAIAGFLNAEGGTLLIGMTDDKKPIGIKEEVDEFYGGSYDKFSLELNATIELHLGGYVLNYLKIDRLVDVVRVECRKCDHPVFSSFHENIQTGSSKRYFYVRFEGQTSEKFGEEIIKYLNTENNMRSNR